MVAVEIDHYAVLRLPSGEEGAKLSALEIHNVYKSMALLLHPDKRRDDPNAHANFLKFKESYEVLKDENARKSFDDQLRIEREKKLVRQRDSKKRQRMMSDLEEKEEEEKRYHRQRDLKHVGFGVYLSPEEEERYSRKLNEEIERVNALHLKQKQATKSSSSKQKEYATDRGGSSNYYAAMQSSASGLEREKVVKVLWEKTGIREDYTAERLYKIFGKFGCVEDVVIRKRKGSALVVMASKYAAIAIVETAGFGLDDYVGNNGLKIIIYGG